MTSIRKHIVFIISLLVSLGCLYPAAYASIGYNALPSLTAEQAGTSASLSKASGSSYVSFNNIREVDKAVLAKILAMMPDAILRFREMRGGDVKFQLEFDKNNMAAFPDNTSLAVHENPRASQQVFTRFFSGRLESYKFPDIGSPYGACLSTNLKNPEFYVYDPDSYTYYKLGEGSLYMDKSGFAHIAFTRGYLIVSSGPLQLRPTYK